MIGQMSKRVVAFMAVVLWLAGIRAEEVAPGDGRIQWHGRIDWTSDKGMPRFTYPGVSARMAFNGTEARMSARKGSGWFVAQIDDDLPVKVSFAEDSVVTLASGRQSARMAHELARGIRNIMANQGVGTIGSR